MPRPLTIASLAILALRVIWGAAYLWMKTALDTSEVHLGADAAIVAIALYLCVRFGLGAAAVLVLPAARHGLRSRVVWRAGAWLGGLLLLAFVLQLYGLRGVDPAVSAFLTSLYVVFTALVMRLTRGSGLDMPLAAGVVLATAGAAWIGGPPALTFDGPEWLTVSGALVFAVHILATDVLTRDVCAQAVTAASLLVVAAGAAVVLGCAWVVGGVPRGVGDLLVDTDYVVAVLLSAVLATAVALVLMNRFQRELPPVRAAILYALEPVWAALFAVSLGRAAVTQWLWIGGGALILGNLVAEIAPRRASQPYQGGAEDC